MELDSRLKNILDKSETDLRDIYKEIDEQCLKNSIKVLNAFKKNNVSEAHFNMTTGYGYNDIGRDTIEEIYSNIFGGEDALVRNQFISGSHAITVSLFGLLRPNDIMLCISGTPYDTLHEVIGIKDNNSSLKSFGVIYNEIDLVNDDFDYKKIEKYLKKETPKIVYIQRSKGYSTRKSITIEKIEKVIQIIKKINKELTIVIDNCYCEFVEDKSPLEVGADIIIGSLIKNLGAGMASNGAYVVGKKELIHLIAERLTVPGEGKDVGPSLGANKEFLKGLYFAPSVVAASIKTAVLTSYILENLGYNVEPKYNEKRADIVQNIVFNDRDKLINYCKSIQSYSAIDSNAVVEPSEMPGYDDEIIMASGSFTQGSSIEISCDGPLRTPFIAYQQGSLTFEYGKIAIINSINELLIKK
ncbi:MAG: methionine gamma-lyase family protein [bacterium]|nr:methionine gamma-lyase family protein [bacterium]